MAARFFGFCLVAAMAVLAAAPVTSPAWAIDTNISGAELLARCQGTPALLKSDQLYCKGYLEGIEDMIAETRAQGKPAEFCVPTGGVNEDQLRQAYITWGQANASEMRQSARDAALAALSATYPCKP